MHKKRNSIIICIVVLILGSIIGYSACNRNELKKNGILLSGVIVSEHRGSKSRWWFNYEFEYEGKVYKRDKPVYVLQLPMFVSKRFPIIFSPQSGRSDMLITPRDFKSYRLAFPDSLNWVKKYVDKNKYRL